MIRPLRSAHRAAWNALALLLPLGIAAALAARPEFPREDLAALEPGAAPLPAEVLALATGSPDVLVYWSASPANSPELPAGARLLGRADHALASLEPLARDGSIVLYSLAQQRVIARLPVSEILP